MNLGKASQHILDGLKKETKKRKRSSIPLFSPNRNETLFLALKMLTLLHYEKPLVFANIR